MTAADLEHALRIARQIAREAGVMLTSAFQQPKNVEFKGRTDLVTETDKKIEDFIKKELHVAFPTHRFLGEETMAALKDAGKPAVEELSNEPTWIVDPVDGTTNFVHAVPYCCISMGLAVDGHAVLGVVYNPVANEMFSAIKGKGAFCNDLPINVAQNHELVLALVATGIPQDRSYLREVVQGNLLLIQNQCQALRINGSCALDLCSVACGRLDIYYEYSIHSWDVAAGAIIASEAGAIVKDPLEKEFSLCLGRVMAGNPTIVKKFLEQAKK